MQKFYLILFILIKSIVVFAQGQNNNWHFGQNSSLSFARGYAAPQNGSQINTGECSASISDSIGRLLFYTNGDMIWTKNHAAMPNGTGLFGWSEVQQCALIVPKPDNPYIYYIFTIGNPGPNDAKELRYSIVDMTLNDSLGDVTEKNILLDNNVTEKLTATKNRNGIDFWVVEKNLVTNQFKSYAVTEEGVSTIPVVTTIGVPIQNGDYSGAIKISNNGCWMISTIRGIKGNPGIVEVFHFDNSNGIVYDGASTTAIEHPYGIEFSSDSYKSYVGENARKPIHQFNMASGNEKKIISSLLDVSDTIPATYSFQLGPDNKIYFATDSTSTLGCIQNPNSYYRACGVIPYCITGLDSSTGSLPNLFNLPYKGSLACSDILDGCAIDLDKYMPKAFTPNGDGLNDCYGIKYKELLPFLDFAIYNRWGDRVFEARDEFDCWDGTYKGKPADPANYVYYLRLKVDCGYTIKKGYVVLIR